LGIQGGLTQRNVNYQALYFHDQFDGFTGYTLSTNEEFPGNNFSFSDYNVGLNYSAEVGRKGRVYAGAALHHFTRPQVSFYESTTDGGRLFSKASFQLSANLPTSKSGRIALLPRFLIASQGPHLEMNAGTNVRVSLGQYGSSAIHFGSWVRPVKSVNGMNLDAVVALVGFELNSVLLGLSYDLNPKALQARQRQSAFEISIAYLGSYENESILCPKF
jgi:type IX secretion system PorP/SprF family membrane protein